MTVHAMERIDRIEFSTEIVTPAIAKVWLANNVESNRKVRPKKVEQYANDMRSGAWQNNGETIKFDRDGHLIDGQHRLAAVVESGLNVELVVVRGVQPDASKTIDTGMARRFSDVLKFNGGSDVAVTSAIVRRIWMWDRGQRATGGGGGSGAPPSSTELLEHYEGDVAGFRMSAGRGNDIRHHTMMMSASTGGAAFYLFARVDHTAAMEFVDRFISGANLGTGHPILALRQRLLRRATERLTETERLALTIRAWNFYRAEEPVERLQVSGPQGLTNKTFPIPK